MKSKLSEARSIASNLAKVQAYLSKHSLNKNVMDAPALEAAPGSGSPKPRGYPATSVVERQVPVQPAASLSAAPASGRPQAGLVGLASSTLSSVEEAMGPRMFSKMTEMVLTIAGAKRVFCQSGGAETAQLTGFALRLAELGLETHVLGLPTCPPLSGEGDVVVLSSFGQALKPTARGLLDTAERLNARSVLLQAGMLDSKAASLGATYSLTLAHEEVGRAVTHKEFDLTLALLLARFMSRLEEHQQDRLLALEVLKLAEDAVKRAEAAAALCVEYVDEASKLAYKAKGDVARAEDAYGRSQAAVDELLKDKSVCVDFPDLAAQLEAGHALAGEFLMKTRGGCDEVLGIMSIVEGEKDKASRSAVEARAAYEKAKSAVDALNSGGSGVARQQLLMSLDTLTSDCENAARTAEEAAVVAEEALNRMRSTLDGLENLCGEVLRNRQECEGTVDNNLDLADMLRQKMEALAAERQFRESGELHRREIKVLSDKADKFAKQMAALLEDAEEVARQAAQEAATAAEVAAKADSLLSEMPDNCEVECPIEAQSCRKASAECAEHASKSDLAARKARQNADNIRRLAESAERAKDTIEGEYEIVARMVERGGNNREAADASLERAKRALATIEDDLLPQSRSLASSASDNRDEAESERKLAEDCFDRCQDLVWTCKQLSESALARPKDIFKILNNEVGTGKKLDNLFKKFDKSSDGKLDAREIKTLIRSVYPAATDWEVRHFQIYADLDGNGRMDLEELRQAMKQVVELGAPVRAIGKATLEQNVLDAEDLLSKFQIAMGGKKMNKENLKRVIINLVGEEVSVIGSSELQKILRKLLPGMNGQERQWVISQCWTIVDEDRDGKLSIDELLEVLLDRKQANKMRAKAGDDELLVSELQNVAIRGAKVDAKEAVVAAAIDVSFDKAENVITEFSIGEDGKVSRGKVRREMHTSEKSEAIQKHQARTDTTRDEEMKEKKGKEARAAKNKVKSKGA